MLKKKERLDKASFNRFFSEGKRFHSPLLMLVYAECRTLKASAVAPKKFTKTAVLRNKFRRRVYDVFERCKKESNINGAFICIAKEGAALVAYEPLKRELLTLIRKTGALR